jgi:hypothetical protein
LGIVGQVELGNLKKGLSWATAKLGGATMSLLKDSLNPSWDVFSTKKKHKEHVSPERRCVFFFGHFSAHVRCLHRIPLGIICTLLPTPVSPVNPLKTHLPN